MTSISAASDTPLRRRRFICWLVAAMLLLIVLVAGVWHERALLLRGVADLWIVSDPLSRSDVVAILGGGLDVRPFVAADLYKKGLVAKVLVSRVAETQSS